MNKKYIILIIVIIAVLLFWFFGRGIVEQPTLSEEDQQARIDDKSMDQGTPPQDVEVFPDTELGQKLKQHIRIIALPAENMAEADENYSKSLVELRKTPAEAVKLLDEAYQKIEDRHYFNRWAMVNTLGDLAHAEAYKSLTSIAHTAIPAEKSGDLHHFSSQEEEIIIRVRAVEGLATLAKQGNKDADQTLLDLALNSPLNSAIQLRAIKGYLNAGRDTDVRVKTLTRKLDKSLHDVITAQVTPPEEFAKRVEELTSVSPEKTNLDASEEKLPVSDVPRLPVNTTKQ